MATLVVEHVTDPLSPWCWAAQPVVRRLQYELDGLEVVPRLVPVLPDTDRAASLPDGVTSETLGERFAAAARGTSMPVAEDLWAEGIPRSSRPACEAVALVRETHPDRVEAYLHRLREAAFVAGEQLDDPDRLGALAGEVGLDDTGLGQALADGRAAAVLEADLERAEAVAAELVAGDVEVRGNVTLLDAVPGRGATDERERPTPAPRETASTDDEGDVAAEPARLAAPPALRFETGDRPVLADPRIGYQRLAGVGGRAVPRQVAGLSDKYATGRLAMHVPQDVAESLSSERFDDEVRAYVSRFGRVTVAEVAAGTGRTPETCRACLESLAETGSVERVGADVWRMIEGGGRTTGPV